MRTLLAAVALSPSLALAQGFPVTFEGEFGPAHLEAPPERIVVVGVHEQDFLYALGIAPVGVHEWWGEHPYATWPWAEAAREAVGATPEVLTGWELNPEWVASLDPDLIVATYFGDLTEADHAVLSQIAPVLTPPPGTEQWGIGWTDELRLLARATGTGDRAEAVIADLDAQLAEARAAYPQLKGRTAATGYLYQGVVQTFNSADTAHRFLQDLGLVIPPEYDDLASERGGLDVSPENLSLIDLDAMIFPDEPVDGGELAAMSVFQALDLAREGRAVNLGSGNLAAALSFQTPLARAWLYEAMPPLLAAAVDGDPATPVPTPPEAPPGAPPEAVATD